MVVHALPRYLACTTTSRPARVLLNLRAHNSRYVWHTRFRTTNHKVQMPDYNNIAWHCILHSHWTLIFPFGDDHVGQTLPRVLVDTTVPSFSHGHTYVALSRTPKREAFHLWSKECASGDRACITNVVYDDLLLPDTMPRTWDVVQGGSHTVEEEGYSSMDD